MEPSPCLQPLYNAQSTTSFTPTEQSDVQNSGAYYGDNGYAQQPHPQQNYQQYAMTTMSPVPSPSVTTQSQAAGQDYGPMFGAPQDPLQFSPTPGSDSQGLSNGFSRMMPPNRFLESQQPLHTLRLPPHSNPAHSNFNYGSTTQSSNAQYGALQDSATNNKRTFLGEITETDSSSNTRESAHINRKKRKACGRCGPCQRKDNCGTCMNCVNRAKGKQICIFRKCEELKKKPSSEAYSTSEMRADKRKDLDSLHSPSEKKRLKGKESLNSPQSALQLPPQYPGYQNKPFSPHNPSGYSQFESVPANSLLHDTFHSTPSNTQSSNIHWQSSGSPAIPQADFTNLSPQSGGYIQQDQRNLPDQILSNLRRYNAPSSFQRNPVSQKNPEHAFHPAQELIKESKSSPLTHQYPKPKDPYPDFPDTNPPNLSLLNELDSTYNEMLPHSVGNDSLLFRYPQSTSQDINTLSTTNELYEPPSYVPTNSMSYSDQKWVQQPVQQATTNQSPSLQKPSQNMSQPNLQYGNGLLNDLRSPISSLVHGSPPSLQQEPHMSPCIGNMPQLASSPNTVPQESEAFTGEHFLDKTGSSAKACDDLLSSQSNLVLTASLSNTTSEQSKSPNKDTNSISPGESGYDSTEMSMPSDEFMSNHFLSSQNNDNNLPSVPKNLYPASVEPPSQTVSDNSEQLVNATGAVTSSQGHTPHSELKGDKSTFELSLDEHIAKTPVRLRRYSNPNATFTTQEQPHTPSSDPLNAMAGPKSHETTISTTSSDSKVYVEHKPKPKLAYGPLDTPPMTPNSSSNNRKFSAEFVSTYHPIPSVMQTPPYSGDAWSCKKYEQRFFGCQATPEQHQLLSQEVKEPTFKELRGIPKTITTETAGKKIQKTVYVYPECNCIQGCSSAEEEPPYYTHLGAAKDVPGIRALFEKRTGFKGKELRIEKVIYSGKEGKTSRGCPIAKWILRRGSETEKILVVCRHRPGHHCPTAYITVVVVLWEGVAGPLADYAYENYKQIIPNNTEPTERKCATNEMKTCACQGFNDDNGGASFSFGCSWSMYYNGCKFARSAHPKKFRLTNCKDEELEKFIEVLSTKLATVVSPIYKMATPHAHANQVEYQEDGLECRLGDNDLETGRPFCGFTTCFDFCAHAHKDSHNMDNGSTVVVTLTKPELRGVGNRPADEQLHVLPLYKLDLSNEDGTFDGVSQKIVDGSVEILSGFRREVRMRDEPYLNKKQRQKLARKKRNSTFEDINSPRKRRGRPPKRSLSVEDLTQIADVETKAMMAFPPNVQRTTGFAALPMHPGMMHSHAIPTPFNQQTPSRWPYRRPSDGMTQQPSFSPVSTPIFYSPVTPNPKPGNEHLPSIGSFLSPKSNETKPSSLPSLDTVMSHPHHKNFSVVKPHTPLSQQSIESSPEIIARKISLKSFAVGSSDNSVSHPPTFPSANHTIKVERPCPPYPSFQRMNSSHETPPQQTANVPHQINQIAAVQDTPRPNPPLRNISHSQSYMNPNIRIPPMHGQAAPTYISQLHNDRSMHSQMMGDPYYNAPKPPPVKSEVYSDSEDNFSDPSIGGVAIAPTHGSVIIECAKRELHATTPLLRPDRFHPSRISLVFYQHKSMKLRRHGTTEYEAKQQLRDEKREREELEKRLAAEKEQPENLQAAMNSSPAMRLPTLADMYHPPQDKMFHPSHYKQYQYPMLPGQHPFSHDQQAVAQQRAHMSSHAPQQHADIDNMKHKAAHMQPGKQALSSLLHKQMIRNAQDHMKYHDSYNSKSLPSTFYEEKKSVLQEQRVAQMKSPSLQQSMMQRFSQHQASAVHDRMSSPKSVCSSGSQSSLLSQQHLNRSLQHHMNSQVQQQNIAMSQQHMKSPLLQQQMTSPVPQHVNYLLPSQHANSSLSRQHIKSPLPQQRVASPVAPRKHIASPQQWITSPVPQQHVKSPLSQQHMKSMLPQQQINSPLPQQHVKSALPQQYMKSPQQHAPSLLSQHHGASSLPQQHVPSSLSQQHVGSSFPQQYMKSSYSIPQEHLKLPMHQHHQSSLSQQAMLSLSQQRMLSAMPQQQHGMQVQQAHNYLQQSMLHNSYMQANRQQMYHMPPAYQPNANYMSHGGQYPMNNGQYLQKPHNAVQSIKQVPMNRNTPPSINNEVNQQINSQKYFPT